MSYQPFPPLASDERAALKADIAARGVLVPVVVDADTGEVVDGHHRLELAAELTTEGIAIDVPKEVRRFASDAERQSVALAHNLSRRHLSIDQKRAVRVEQQRVYFALRAEDKTQEQAAAMVGVSDATGSAWEAESNSTTGIAFKPADQRVRVPKSEWQDVFDRVEAGEPIAQVAADYQVTPQRIGQIRDVVGARFDHPAFEDVPLPDRRYRCLVIDPPWPIEKIERLERPNQGNRLDYPTMSLDEIQALPVRSLADDGCHVYLWVTQRFLPAGLDLFEAWGVRYQCLMTWVKNVGPTPFSWMYDTEHVLFGRIGSLPLERVGMRLSFEAKVGRHSEKPDVFYERVTQASPGPRLEMFSRSPRDQFDVWGNEVAS